MIEFMYDKASPDADYYEQLSELMERWEYEIVEFKEAKGQYSEDKIGQYFSAISNEANLKNQQYGWFILGVSEQKKKYPVGTAFKQGSPSLLEKFKYEISKETTDGMTFLDIIELYPVYEGKAKRVLMFKIPAAVAGMPTEWKTRYYARNGESLVALQQYKIDIIRGQERSDWTGMVVPGSGISDLDQSALHYAREKYKERMNREHITQEIDALDDEAFLTKLRLMKEGRLTRAAIILLGSEEAERFFEIPPKMMWRLFDSKGMVDDYELFTIPFISAPDRILNRVHKRTYRYLPNRNSLMTEETERYNEWLLRELLHNTIAHSNYQIGGRIYLNEYEEHILITNPGTFAPESVENVLRPDYNPPIYKNPALAEAMVKFRMIDTATSGIKRVYRIQKEKYFPMPDYDLSLGYQVNVTVYGKILDDKYTRLLYDHPELDLETVYLLDQVQKGKGKELSAEAVSLLRKLHLVEGRKNNLFVSSGVSREISEETRYIKNKGFDDKYYRDMIIDYLRTFERAQKSDIRNLLWDKLPDVLDDKKKNTKISSLLTYLRKENRIVRSSDNQQTGYWVLVENKRE